MSKRRNSQSNQNGHKQTRQFRPATELRQAVLPSVGCGCTRANGATLPSNPAHILISCMISCVISCVKRSCFTRTSLRLDKPETTLFLNELHISVSMTNSSQIFLRFMLTKHQSNDVHLLSLWLLATVFSINFTPRAPSSTVGKSPSSSPAARPSFLARMASAAPT